MRHLVLAVLGSLLACAIAAVYGPDLAADLSLYGARLVPTPGVTLSVADCHARHGHRSSLGLFTRCRVDLTGGVSAAGGSSIAYFVTGAGGFANMEPMRAEGREGSRRTMGWPTSRTVWRHSSPG